jgi:hypothetical protein
VVVTMLGVHHVVQRKDLTFLHPASSWLPSTKKARSRNSGNPVAPGAKRSSTDFVGSHFHPPEDLETLRPSLAMLRCELSKFATDVRPISNPNLYCEFVAIRNLDRQRST